VENPIICVKVENLQHREELFPIMFIFGAGE